jgi:hypothetical protein
MSLPVRAPAARGNAPRVPIVGTDGAPVEPALEAGVLAPLAPRDVRPMPQNDAQAPTTSSRNPARSCERRPSAPEATLAPIRKGSSPLKANRPRAYP